MSNQKLRAVDVWANYWTDAFFAAYRPLGEVYDKMGMTGQATHLEKLVEEAPAAGVDKVIISATAVEGDPAGNAEMAKAIAPYSQVLVGCASVDPRMPAAVDEVKRAAQEYGFRALKVLPFLHELAPNDKRYFPIYDACVDLGLPVIFLTGHQATKVSSEIGRPAHIDDIALRYPELTMIAGPGGWPWADELIALAWKHENLIIHAPIAPQPFRDQYLPTQLIHYMKTLGPQKLVWGTGYPFMTHAQPIEDARALEISTEVRDAFLWGNAARIWDFD
jgi:hypothetical protein